MPRRKRSTFGTIERLSGRDHWNLKWWETRDGVHARRSMVVWGTRREAERKLAEIRASMDEGAHGVRLPNRAMTVGEAWSRLKWPELQDGVKSGRYSPKTAVTYESTWRKHVAPRWEATRCRDVRPLDVQGWLERMTMSRGKLCKAVLKATLDQAVLYEAIAYNPMDRAYRYGTDTSVDLGVYTSEELEALGGVVRDSVVEVPFLLMAHAGMRVGEACATPIASVTFGDGAAVIGVSSQQYEDGTLHERLKTKQSTRVTAMADPWASRLREIVEAYPQGAVWTNDDGLGGPVRRWLVTDTWTELVRASDVPYKPMKQLRPSFQTNLHWAGVPAEKMAKLLGHSKPTTTFKYYDKPQAEELARLVREAASASFDDS